MMNFLDQILEKAFRLQKEKDKMEEKIKNIHNELIRLRHFAWQSTQCVEELSRRVRNRRPDDMTAWPGDRAALLNADLVMSEAYKLNQK